MDIDWTQPYVLIFEWGLFIFGWLLIFVLSAIVLSLSFAFIKAAVLVMMGKKPRKSNKTTHDENLGVNRDIYGRFTL